jgi:hypothetical protein
LPFSGLLGTAKGKLRLQAFAQGALEYEFGCGAWCELVKVEDGGAWAVELGYECRCRPSRGARSSGELLLQW